MATPLDTLLLDKFSIIFTWVLIFAAVFAVSESTKFIPNKILTSIIAFCLATLAVLTPTVPKILSSFAPWVVIIAIFFLFMLILSSFIGFSSQQILTALGGKGAMWWVVTPLIIALIFSLSNVFGQGLLNERTTTTSDSTVTTDTSTTTTTTTGDVSTSNHQEAVLFTLTNPKVLGLIFLLLIGMFAILFLTMTPQLPIPWK